MIINELMFVDIDNLLFFVFGNLFLGYGYDIYEVFKIIYLFSFFISI